MFVKGDGLYVLTATCMRRCHIANTSVCQFTKFSFNWWIGISVCGGNALYTMCTGLFILLLFRILQDPEPSNISLLQTTLKTF